MSENNQNNQKPNSKGVSRREFLKVGAAATAAGIVAGAGANVAKAASAVAPRQAPAFLQGAKINVKFLTWFWQEAGRGDAWKAMIDKFHAMQSDIHIDQGGWAFDDYTNQVLIQVKSGKIDGDLLTTTPDLYLRLLRANQLDSMEDVVKKAGVKLSAAHDSLRDKDGNVHGLDVVTVRFGLLYNNAMLQKAGLSEPKSIDDWIAVSQKLTKKPDQFGLYSPHLMSAPESFWFILQQWAVLYDGVWAKGQVPNVTDPAVIKGLKLFKTMYDTAMPQGTDDGTANKMYSSSRIAQQLIVSAAVNVWKTNGPDIYPNLRSALPFWPSGKAITRIHPLTVNVNADADHKAAAKEFAAWLYTKENYQELLERCLDVIPAVEGGIRKEYHDSLFWAAGYDAAKAITPPEVLGDFIFYDQEFGKIVLNKFQQSLTGSKPVEDSMAEAQKDLEAMAKRVFSS